MFKDRNEKLIYIALVVATFLYAIYGVAHTLYSQEMFLLKYHFLASAFCIIGGYLIQKYFGSIYMIFLASICVLATTFYVSSYSVYNDHDLVFAMALMFGIMEFTWMLPQWAAFINFGICLVYSVLCFYAVSANTTLTYFAIIPFSTLFSWKVFTAYFQHKAYQGQLSYEKFKVFQATMLRFNHEFNNIGMIILGKIKILEKKKDSDISEKDFTNLKISMERFLYVIKQARELETFQTEKYSENSEMLKMDTVIKAESENESK